MRILMFDIDTLRPDHLSCYGYPRPTSPNIDRIAAEGIRFENYYVTDAPCLPSRAALLTGQFGIHNGAVNHGGTNADLHLEGPQRSFRQRIDQEGFFAILRRAGLYTASISPFSERHSSYWFTAGLNELYNTAGLGGLEGAEQVEPAVIDWLTRNRERDNWFLHVNLWDPHTPYRVPMDYGNPFEHEPAPDWLTQERLDEHRASFGTHSAADVMTFMNPGLKKRCPRVPEDIKTLDDFGQWIDGYDVGIRYADDTVGRVLALLEQQGLLEDTIILVTSDHGENQGELNIYGDHHTADHITSRIPMIIRWPGKIAPGSVDRTLHYQIDLLPTLAQSLNVPVSPRWDGQSYAAAFDEPNTAGREFLVVSQMAWSCQRSVRWENWMLIRTYHTGIKDLAPVMLFDVAADPHEENDLSAERPDVVAIGLALLEQWHSEQMGSGASPVDPMQTVLREGGPFHTRSSLKHYCEHLRRTGRGQHADHLTAEFGKTNWA